MNFRVVLTDRAKKDLSEISNPVIRERIAQRINVLKTRPEVGNPLRGKLAGYRSLRAARNRYRIIYRIVNDKVLVIIITIGLRKGDDFGDVYKSLKRLIGKRKK